MNEVFKKGKTYNLDDILSIVNINESYTVDTSKTEEGYLSLSSTEMKEPLFSFYFKKKDDDFFFKCTFNTIAEREDE